MPPDASQCRMVVRTLIRRAPIHLGLPSNQFLVRLMRTASCQQAALYYAWHRRCPTCLRRRPPHRIPRATLLYRPTRVNQVAGLDLTIVRDTQGVTYTLINVADLATRYNTILLCESTTPAFVLNVFKRTWVAWAYMPEHIVVDTGSEFGAECLVYT